MLYRLKKALFRAGLFPFARDVFRSISPHHRNERRLRQEFFSQLVQPGDLCFDVGANLGQTIEALQACDARVVAFEPNPHCLPNLRRLADRDPNVHIVAKAIGASPGSARLHFHDTAATASLREGWNSSDHQAVEVEVTTLGWAMREFGIPQFLKVDVEGFEVETFKGLERAVPLIYFEMHGSETEAVAVILRRLGEIGIVEKVNAASEDHGSWLLKEWVAPERFLSVLNPVPTCANVVVRMRT